MYSGNISSITWSDAGSGQTNRGYRYTYDDLNRLVNAEYGEDNFSTGIGRYNERLGYDGNSNVTSLQRKGVTQEGSYGLIDDLRLGYDGNQLSKVEENAPAVLYAGSLDVKRSTSDIRYNANGSLTMDGTRDITHIDYDLHNNPLRIQFANGNVTKYVYSAAGEKLRAIHYTAVANTHVEMGQVYADIEKRHLAVDSTDYRLGGNAVFNNGSFSKVLFDGGYVELVAVDMPGSGYNMPIVKPWKPPFGGRWPDDLGGGKKGPTIYSLRFRYFNRDHLGNVREVVSETAEVKQVNAYYPFGTPIHALGTKESQQRYKYNGKEFDELHGLNTYDYGARQYAPLLPLWNRVDPLAEESPEITPYAYCHDNPIMRIDPDGAFDFDNTIKQYMHYGVIAVFPTNLGSQEEAIRYDYNKAKSAGVPLMRVDNMQDFANAMAALRNMHTTTETYTLNSHGSRGSFNSPASFYIGTDIITPETDFSSLRGGLCGHFVFIGACNVGNVYGRGYELVENMARQTSSTVIASGHPLRAGYKYDGSNYLNEWSFPYKVDPDVQLNNYIFSEKGGEFRTILDVTIDKDKGIYWKEMDMFSKLPVFRR